MIFLTSIESAGFLNSNFLSQIVHKEMARVKKGTVGKQKRRRKKRQNIHAVTFSVKFVCHTLFQKVVNHDQSKDLKQIYLQLFYSNYYKHLVGQTNLICCFKKLLNLIFQKFEKKKIFLLVTHTSLFLFFS